MIALLMAVNVISFKIVVHRQGTLLNIYNDKHIILCMYMILSVYGCIGCIMHNILYMAASRTRI